MNLFQNIEHVEQINLRIPWLSPLLLYCDKCRGIFAHWQKFWLYKGILSLSSCICHIIKTGLESEESQIINKYALTSQSPSFAFHYRFKQIFQIRKTKREVVFRSIVFNFIQEIFEKISSKRFFDLGEYLGHFSVHIRYFWCDG